MSHSIEGVSNEDLACLNSWPIGTVGFHNDQQVIMLLNALCKEHGYGRIPQIAAAIEDIWRNPEKVEQYQRMRRDRLEQLESDRRWLEENADSE